VSTLTLSAPTTFAATAAEEALGAVAPGLISGFRASLPRAADVVGRRLLGAAYREGLADRTRLPATATRHAFDRVEIAETLAEDPALLLRGVLGEDHPVAAELTDATVNLAVAYARRARSDTQLTSQAAACGARDSLDLASGLDADAQCVFFERFATEGHNLHPCARTRLGWGIPDLLAHDLESPFTRIGLVGVRRDLHVGTDVGAQLRDLLGPVSIDATRYALTPVHMWQLDRVVRGRYSDLAASGAIIPVDAVSIPGAASAALRTLLLPPDRDGGRRYLKLSLDIQVTSTRRTISVASTQNGPALSTLLGRLLGGDDAGRRVLLMAEVAGSAMAVPGGRERDLAAILRRGLSGRLEPGEVAVPGSALYAVSPITGMTVLAELVERYAGTRGISDRPLAALAFLGEYARLVLPPVLTLATRHGIGLEAHLQNCVPTFVDGIPNRLGLRDFAGLRLYLPRLRHRLDLWPGSVVVANDIGTMRAKLAYTVLQAHLGELVVRLVGSHAVDERAAWSSIRVVVDEVYAQLLADPSCADAARDDHGFLTGAMVPHKALLRMRLTPEMGDIYVRVENPLR